MSTVPKNNGIIHAILYTIFFHVSWITKCSFKDINKPINSSIKKTTFLISSNFVNNKNNNNNNNNNFVNKKRSKSIYYMIRNRKYKFYNS